MEDCFNFSFESEPSDVRKKDSSLWSKTHPPPVSGLNLSSEGTRISKSSVEVEDRLNFSFESDLEVGKKEKFEF